jgi:hypothetical protein
MNTRIHYLYRDASNYKQGNEIIVIGELRFAELEPLLDDGGFAPEDVGLFHPGHQLTKFPGNDDHCWCELEEEDVELTDDKPTMNELTAQTLLERFRKAHADGWPAQLDDKYAGVPGT